MHTRSGVLTRTRTSVPLSRVEGVDVSEPLLQRVLGLATVRLEVAGGADSDVTLSGVSRAVAGQLRARALVGGASGRQEGTATRPSDRSSGPSPDLEGPPAEGDGEPAVQRPSETEEAERLVVALDARRARRFLRYSVLLYLMALWAIGTTVWSILRAMQDGLVSAIHPALLAAAGFGGLASALWQRYQRIRTWRVMAEAAVASRTTAMSQTTTMRVSHGRLSRTSVTIKGDRVLGVALSQGPLQRHGRWWEVEVAAAGYGNGGEQTATTVCPAATGEEALRLIEMLLPELTAEHRQEIAAALARPEPPATWLRPAPASRWFSPLAWRRQGARLLPQHLVTVSGRWARGLRVLRRARVQTVELAEGPLARQLGLAHVWVAMPPGPLRLVGISHLERSEAVTVWGSLILSGERGLPGERESPDDRPPRAAGTSHGKGTGAHA